MKDGKKNGAWGFAIAALLSIPFAIGLERLGRGEAPIKRRPKRRGPCGLTVREMPLPESAGKLRRIMLSGKTGGYGVEDLDMVLAGRDSCRLVEYFGKSDEYAKFISGLSFDGSRALLRLTGGETLSLELVEKFVKETRGLFPPETDTLFSVYRDTKMTGDCIAVAMLV